MIERYSTLTGAATLPVARRRHERRPALRVVMQQHWPLYIMLIPSLVCLALFNFYPLWGLSLAFVKYNLYKGLAASPFVGLANFRSFLAMPEAWPLFRNTLVIAIGKIVAGEVAAVVFALLLHEVRSRLYKRGVQTLTTLPHFLSWVIVGGIMTHMLSGSGVVNRAIAVVGGAPIRFLGDARVFPWTVILSETWKEFGWGAVIYLAALAGINPELYEAAAVDGAGRWARLLHVTIPGLTPTIVLMSCLSLGGILNAGFDQLLVLQNAVVMSTGDIIDTFVYRVGLLNADYSLGTAVGLLSSVLGFVLIVLSYWLADRLANYRIF